MKATLEVMIIDTVKILWTV